MDSWCVLQKGPLLSAFDGCSETLHVVVGVDDGIYLEACVHPGSQPVPRYPVSTADPVKLDIMQSSHLHECHSIPASVSAESLCLVDSPNLVPPFPATALPDEIAWHLRSWHVRDVLVVTAVLSFLLFPGR